MRGAHDLRMSAGFVETLLLHDWKENLRELSGVVHNAARSAANGELHREHLSFNPANSREEPGPIAIGMEPASPELNRETIEAVLRETGGNVRETCARLRVERTKLYRILKGLGIELEAHRRK